MDTSRRGFLQGLLGVTVVAILPAVHGDAAASATAYDAFRIQAPEGLTYQWVRTALLGEPDPENVRLRLANGWRFVTPQSHPDAPTSKLGEAIESHGLVLMQRPTAEVNAQEALRKASATIITGKRQRYSAEGANPHIRATPLGAPADQYAAPARRQFDLSDTIAQRPGTRRVNLFDDEGEGNA